MRSIRHIQQTLSVAALIAVSMPVHATSPSTPTSQVSAAQRTLFAQSGGSAPVSPYGVRAKWTFASYGDAPGECGIVMQKLGAKTEVITGGSLGSTADDYVYGFEFDPSTKEYITTFSTPLVTNTVAKVAIGDVLPRPGKELVVVDGNGQFAYYDLQTKNLLAKVAAPSLLVGCATLADLDGDGLDEIVECSFNRTRVSRSDGTVLFEIVGIGGATLAVGQFDSDPSLEIATQNGAIIDYATQSVQTTLGYNTATGLCAADIDGDGKQELISTDLSKTCRVWDVATGATKLQFPVADDGAVVVGDPLGNGSTQIVVAGRVTGRVAGYSAATGAQSWSIDSGSGSHGATNLLIGDVNDDGKPEVIWGAGIADNGPDSIAVGNATTQSILWNSVRLVGPFLGPFFGDLDGDGNAELVAGANTEVSGGKFVVLDAATHQYRGTSPYLGFVATHLAAITLADLSGSGRQQVLAGCQGLNGALIQAWQFDSNGQFALTWQNSVEPGGAVFHSIDAADIDGLGHEQIIGGEQKLSGPPWTALIHAYDYATRAEVWNAPLAGNGATINAVRVVDLNGDGVAEIVGELQNDAIWIFDGMSKALESKISGSWSTFRIRTEVGSGLPEIWAADAFGRLLAYRWNGTTYALIGTHNVLPPGTAVEAFDFGRLNSVYIARQDILSFESTPDATNELWSIGGYGLGSGREVVELPAIHELVTAGSFSIVGLRTYP